MREPSAGARSRWWRRVPSSPRRVVAIYAAIGITWIAFSDRVVAALFTDPAAYALAQTLKGTFFIVATSLVLYVLIRRGERGLLRLSAEVRATVDSMADAVLVVDGTFRIVEANRAAVALLGAASKEDILGPLEEWGRRYQLRGPDGAPVPFERYASVRALAGEASARYGAVLRRADGTDVYVSVSAAPVERPDGGRLAVAVLRDETAARRLDAQRDDFLSTAAHELKTPLAVVKAYAQLMRRREPREAQALAVIERQVNRLSRLVQQMLDASRLRLERGGGRLERFDLSALAGEIVDAMRGAAPRHALHVDAAGPAPVLGDRDRIGRVLTCLVDNAVRFSPSGGDVEAHVEADGGEVHVAVRDHGVGIPEERQGQVFERFYRAHAGTPEDYGGLGVGLDLAREIVRRHGGRIWFESTPGGGSTFHFSLPAAREDA
ncbi:MAG TPA: PAS domain-containing sensor histidine kinase [Anaeromyxobacter sp.]|nr:PAS domain-containing sensor histidine kinase [Anaeromyxobacter sp.]